MGNSEAAQSYEIYVNDSLLTLTSLDGNAAGLHIYEDTIRLRYFGHEKLLLNVMDNLEKAAKPRHIVLLSDELEDLFSDFTKLFRWIEAAGGVVENKSGEILTIYRRKKWDLPKGKLDPGETFEEAAVREVIEETGLSTLESHYLLTSSLHTFRTKRNERALKLTKWYMMTTEHLRLKLQKEEDIEDAAWLNPEDIIDSGFNTFESIRHVVRHYLDLKSSN